MPSINAGRSTAGMPCAVARDRQAQDAVRQRLEKLRHQTAQQIGPQPSDKAVAEKAQPMTRLCGQWTRIRRLLPDREAMLLIRLSRRHRPMVAAPIAVAVAGRLIL